jgi:hypothetical protein
MYRCTTRAVSPRIHRGAKARVVAAASASNRSRAASAESNRDTGTQRSPNSTFQARCDVTPAQWSGKMAMKTAAHTATTPRTLCTRIPSHNYPLIVSPLIHSAQSVWSAQSQPARHARHVSEAVTGLGCGL